MTRVGERRLGKWTVGRRIGKGGQATVFEATSGEASEVHAIKPISTNRNKKGARFRQEIEQHVRLSGAHAANILPVIDWSVEVRDDGSTDGYIVMPRAYASLDDAATTFEGRVELSLEVFRGIVRGVQGAHDLGVIHRDLKPANILFLEPSLREPYVADLGICLLKDARPEDRLTDVGETVGARFYMAPEQERGGVVDVAEGVDIYALGKILYFMLTGRNLYREEVGEAFTEAEILKDRRLAIIRDDLIARCVVTSPGLRLKSAADLGALVDELLHRFRGGPPTGGADGSPRSSPPDDTAMEPELTDPARAVAESYDASLREIMRNDPRLVSLRFDRAKNDFDRSWNVIRAELKPLPDSLLDGATTLARKDLDVTGSLLAIARFDSIGLFDEVRAYLEYILASTEAYAGDRRIRSVPHLVAGFHYMTLVVAAVARQSWQLLSSLLNLKLQWYYQSSRPLYSYAIDLPYFFHPEALERKATAAHDFYVSLVSGAGVSPLLGRKDADPTTWYVQAQFLMCINAARLTEAGETDVDPFAYFGRFYSERLSPLLKRMEDDEEFAQGVTRAFDESPEGWFARLPARLEKVRTWFDHGRFDWASLRSWPE